jgi:hypothetical protein
MNRGTGYGALAQAVLYREEEKPFSGKDEVLVSNMVSNI